MILVSANSLGKKENVKFQAYNFVHCKKYIVVSITANAQENKNNNG
jgi:hypothetical protein